MGYSCSFFTYFFLLTVLLNITNVEPRVPALIIFGDSIVDVGNNNKLYTIVKANFPPYGRDFENHSPIGRFCNGKLAIDFLAEFVGLAFYPPAYLNLKDERKEPVKWCQLCVISFGYSDSTSKLYGTISLNQQLAYYKDYRNELVKIAGQSNASSILSSAVYVVSTGSNDFVLDYYINPLLNKVYTVHQFSDILMGYYSILIQNLYTLGARKIGVTTIPPIGCLPLVITAFGSHNNECVATLNNDAITFNEKLNVTSENLLKMLPGLNLVVLDVFQPLYDIITKPSKYGFLEARKACCGTGLLETSILCNQGSLGTCPNASEYVFWDSFHPSEATNKILVNYMISEGRLLIS